MRAPPGEGCGVTADLRDAGPPARHDCSRFALFEGRMTCVIPSRHHVNRQAVIQADLRDPAAILAAPETTRLIDFSEPVGLTLGSQTPPPGCTPPAVAPRIASGHTRQSRAVLVSRRRSPEARHRADRARARSCGQRGRGSVNGRDPPGYGGPLSGYILPSGALPAWAVNARQATREKARTGPAGSLLSDRPEAAARMLRSDMLRPLTASSRQARSRSGRRGIGAAVLSVDVGDHGHEYGCCLDELSPHGAHRWEDVVLPPDT